MSAIMPIRSCVSLVIGSLLLAGLHHRRARQRRCAPPANSAQISAAADRAAAQLSLGIPASTRIFIDTRYFQGYDDGYAIAAIRAQMMKTGLMLVDDRAWPKRWCRCPAGALSTDQKSGAGGPAAIDRCPISRQAIR